MKLQVPHMLAVNNPGAYLVGGSVRDLIRGRKPVDFDITVPCNPRVYAQETAKRSGGRVVLLGKDPFPVYRVTSADGDIDITIYKGRDIQQDLMTRDFTINALACSLADGEIIDATNGLDDLHQGVVRMVSPTVFQEDPARLVRAFRMAATLNFQIHGDTFKTIKTHAALLRKTAGERIWAELIRILSCPDSHPHLSMMAETGVLNIIFPELTALQKCFHNRQQTISELDHSLQAVQNLEHMLRSLDSFLPDKICHYIGTRDQEKLTLLKMSLLMLAVGKPVYLQTESDGRNRFGGHAARSAEFVRSMGRRLRMSNRQREFIADLVRRQQRPLLLFLSRKRDEFPRPEVFGRFLRQCGRQAPYLLIQAIAQQMADATAGSSDQQPRLEFLISVLGTYVEKNLDRGLTPILKGHELMACFQLRPSPHLGSLLRRLEELQLAGSIADRQQAIEWVAEHLKKHPLPDRRGVFKGILPTARG